MTSPLVSVLIALLLSISSLIVVLVRVSPLTAPEFALPFFFAIVLIAVSSLAALLLVLAKSLLQKPPEGAAHGGHFFLSRAVLRSSLRQGMLFGVATCMVLLLFLLRIHNVWIAVLVYAVFILIEMAVGRE